jgi:hypothetical protein
MIFAMAASAVADTEMIAAASAKARSGATETFAAGLEAVDKARAASSAIASQEARFKAASTRLL